MWAPGKRALCCSSPHHRSPLRVIVPVSRGAQRSQSIQRKMQTNSVHPQSLEDLSWTRLLASQLPHFMPSRIFKSSKTAMQLWGPQHCTPALASQKSRRRGSTCGNGEVAGCSIPAVQPQTQSAE